MIAFFDACWEIFLLSKITKFNDNFHMYRYYLLAILTQTAIASYAPYVQIALRNKGYSYSLVGVIISLGQAFAIIGPLVISSITDKNGKTKPWLIISALCSIIFGLPFFLSGNVFTVIVAVCLLDFFFWSLNPLVDGFLNRKLYGMSYKYGQLRAFGTLGYLIALAFFALSGFPSDKDNSSILTCFLIFVSLFLIASLIQSDDRREKKERKAFSFSWFDRGFYLFMGIVALTRIGQSVVEKMLSSYMTETLKLGGYFSLFIALGAFFEFMCMILFGRLLKNNRTTPFFMLFLSAIALTVRLLLYLIPNIWVFALAQTLHGLTFGACHVASTTYIARNVSSEHYEVGMSIYWAVATNLPELLGTLAGGFIIDSMGYSTLFLTYAVFPFIAVFLCLLLKKELVSSSVQSK